MPSGWENLKAEQTFWHWGEVELKRDLGCKLASN